MVKKHMINGILVAFIILSGFRYSYVQKNHRYLLQRYGIETIDVYLGKPCDILGLTYTFKEIERKQVFDDFYKQDVIAYTVYFDVKNDSEQPSQEVNIMESMVVLSGGTGWWIDPVENKAIFEQNKTKIQLEPFETTSGFVTIKVIPDKDKSGFYPIEKLQEAEIYYIDKGPSGAYKYKINGKITQL